MTEMTQGQRIRYLRERRGMTRVVCAGLVGRGEDWLKKIENGSRPLRSFGLLARLAAVLDVADIADLAPETEPSVTVVLSQSRRVMHPAMAAIRAACREAAWLPLPDERPDVSEFAGEVRGAWGLWHRSARQRSEVGAMLPDLIRRVHILTRMHERDERRRALLVMADVYHLAQQVAAYSCEPELYWMLADRGLFAARETDDPVALAGAAWCVANGLREAGYMDEAVACVDEGQRQLEPYLDGLDADARGIYGALHLHAAITHARAGREGDAWRRWDAADDLAVRLPGGYWHQWTTFGRANVDIHAVSVATDLLRSQQAVTRSDGVDPATVPSVERRTRLLVEVARAHEQRGEPVAALAMIEDAAATSAESVRYTPEGRNVVGALLRRRNASTARRIDRVADLVGITAD